MSDALIIIIIAICIPVALLLHAFTGASMVRKARATDPASAEMLETRLRSFPSVPLAGVFVFSHF